MILLIEVISTPVPVYFIRLDFVCKIFYKIRSWYWSIGERNEEEEKWSIFFFFLLFPFCCELSEKV